ncbi:hypothetical protein M569_14593, partial [Genlisea aurea]
ISFLQILLQAVLPFDLSLDKKKRLTYFNNLAKCSNSSNKPKVLRDAGIALASLVVCEEALERELIITTSYIPGMEVTLSGRLKSLYSIYSKMKRKDVCIKKIYDARALRVVVGDKNGTLHGQAIQSCYSLLSIIHRLWTPIDGELDDYIVNPKPSGYQSLHTAVQGPDFSPLEVQIRTQKMHDYAEHGLAAHWLYKETENMVPPKIFVADTERISSDFSEELAADQGPTESGLFLKYRTLKVGHPAVRVEAGHLLPAVVIRVDNDGRELLVAVNFCLPASEVVAGRRTSNQSKRWAAHASLYKKVSGEWWFEPGHGDWCTCLEKYTLCKDGIHHKHDQFERLLPTFIQIIELTEQEENEYWGTVSARFEEDGKSQDGGFAQKSVLLPNDDDDEDSESGSMNNKVQLLRSMLQWEEQLCSEAGFRQHDDEVAVVCWPGGGIMRLRSGSTAADAATRIGAVEGKKKKKKKTLVVLVNGQLVLPTTQLKDGDVVEVRL